MEELPCDPLGKVVGPGARQETENLPRLTQQAKHGQLLIHRARLPHRGKGRHNIVHDLKNARMMLA